MVSLAAPGLKRRLLPGHLKADKICLCSRGSPCSRINGYMAEMILEVTKTSPDNISK